MKTTFAGKEQIIACDSDSDDSVVGDVAPHRTVAKRAEMILAQQQRFRSVGEREAGRRELTSLGGAYGEFCRGAPLSIWVPEPAYTSRKRSESDKNEACATAALRTPEKNRNARDDEFLVPNPKTGGRVCGYRSPLPKKTTPPSVVSDISFASAACKGDAWGSQESIGRNSSTASEVVPLTPDGSATSSLLSQAERSAVELLAHDIDSITRECWRASQEQLLPSAIYAEEDRLTAAAAHTTSPSGTAKRKRLRGVCGVATPEKVNDGTARCLQFETDSSMRLLRPSVSEMVLKRFNEQTQQRLASRCFMLPY
ncbi:hypothetical protein MOQ_000703 [Trypanosoma cruzi marinkellei]|uniref:Uncharacterized protein n=1 Tax=Trypanosoma cruzi marinkellei TaxID=85056 RepID=K2NVQ7_TRYCR|nr:hypothetical protein MOQ_000703 [Trypanosoma cruzi marinkellei]